MTKKIAVVLVGLAAVFATAGTVLAQQAPGGVVCGGVGTPAGVMPGPMMGGGMYGGWGYGGHVPRFIGPPAKTVTFDQAIQNARDCVNQLNNPDLVLDEAIEFENNVYVIVKEQSTGIGAFELLVDKQTGAVTPEPGPNMMWNTKYGHLAGQRYGWPGGAMGPGMMGGYGPGMMGGWGPGMMAGPPWFGAPADQQVTAEQAQVIAQQWLDQNQPGAAAETPDTFYGYYTVHYQQDGKVAGMLSVNAATGQVWYHAWHGAFIQEREIGG